MSHCTIAAKQAVTSIRKAMVRAGRAMSRPSPQCSTDISMATCAAPRPATGSQPAKAIRQGEAPAARARLFIGAISMYATIAPTQRESGMKYGAKPVP
ncbi:hypothetical protein GCM10020254_60380 [Streptomyces goshikiensis]